ncbi:MAG: hypothetical protein IPN38_13830 [Flavobacteriales bacterium]|nr:hypothetical protein [Flavobacteriales bacterium]
MRSTNNLKHVLAMMLTIMALLATPADAQAQRGKGGGGGGAKARPSAPAANGGARPTINGGSQKSPARASAPQTNRNAGGDRGTDNGAGDRKPGGDRGGSGSVGDRKPGGGNNSNTRGDVNIGSGNTNVNVNVNNSHNTTVRRNTNVQYKPSALPLRWSQLLLLSPLSLPPLSSILLGTGMASVGILRGHHGHHGDHREREQPTVPL